MLLSTDPYRSFRMSGFFKRKLAKADNNNKVNESGHHTQHLQCLLKLGSNDIRLLHLKPGAWTNEIVSLDDNPVFATLSYV